MVHLPTALFSLSYIRDSSNRCSHYAPLRGATVVTRTVTEGAAEFQSTRPMRGATPMAIHRSLPMPFQSTRPARGATCRRQLCPGRQRHFNPRAPRGARPLEAVILPGKTAFQSTRPMRGATRLQETIYDLKMEFQSTRPARGATPRLPREMRTSRYFNPRAPRGARLALMGNMGVELFISIHALREGRDRIAQVCQPSMMYFNPRAPCGARHRDGSNEFVGRHFNPRAPCGARPES